MARRETILSVKDLRVRFRTLDGAVEAVKGVNIACQGRRDCRHRRRIRFRQEPDDDGGDEPAGLERRGDGHVDYRGRNLLDLESQSSTRSAARKISMIFQEPMTSLDPLYTIGNQLIEPIRRHQRLGARRSASRGAQAARPGADSRSRAAHEILSA